MKMMLVRAAAVMCAVGLLGAERAVAAVARTTVALVASDATAEDGGIRGKLIQLAQQRKRPPGRAIRKP